jgi:hypothetical protein
MAKGLDSHSLKLFKQRGAMMALQIMATGAAISTEWELIGAFARGMGQRLGAAIAQSVQDVFDPYRPELHYMRGPGPKWRKKHGLATRKRHSRR